MIIRLTQEQVDMTWGPSERHLTRDRAEQVKPGCARFTQHKGTLMDPTDWLYVCGAVLEPNAPPVQTTVAFLLTGFQRSPRNEFDH